ncbi:MAG: hypothetical protein IJ496_02720 [Ruminococcus sp.]|nr:hypothetical protein [Ruminococcus sp.]
MTEKFVPYEKLSKKARRALNAKKRRDWGSCNPVTRAEPNKKAYRRHEKYRADALKEE